jgi:hypothetical protein
MSSCLTIKEPNSGVQQMILGDFQLIMSINGVLIFELLNTLVNNWEIIVLIFTNIIAILSPQFKLKK